MTYLLKISINVMEQMLDFILDQPLEGVSPRIMGWLFSNFEPKDDDLQRELLAISDVLDKAILARVTSRQKRTGESHEDALAAIRKRNHPLNLSKKKRFTLRSLVEDHEFMVEAGIPIEWLRAYRGE